MLLPMLIRAPVRTTGLEINILHAVVVLGFTANTTEISTHLFTYLFESPTSGSSCHLTPSTHLWIETGMLLNGKLRDRLVLMYAIHMINVCKS